MDIPFPTIFSQSHVSFEPKKSYRYEDWDWTQFNLSNGNWSAWSVLSPSPCCESPVALSFVGVRMTNSHKSWVWMKSAFLSWNYTRPISPFIRKYLSLLFIRLVWPRREFLTCNVGPRFPEMNWLEQMSESEMGKRDEGIWDQIRQTQNGEYRLVHEEKELCESWGYFVCKRKEHTHRLGNAVLCFALDVYANLTVLYDGIRH
jgi:hypothetical protein